MNIHIIASLARLGLVVFTASALSAGEISKPMELWPNGVPDEQRWFYELMKIAKLVPKE